MIKDIKATIVLEELIKCKKRFCLLVGSSRSSKTWSVLQWIILYCAENSGKGKFISVVRGSFPALRRSVYREFLLLLKEYGLYDEKRHNKTENVVEVFGCFVEFFSVEDGQKIRGSTRDILYLNESNEIDYEPANQLFLRTRERIIMDQNPSNPNHWSFKKQHDDNCDYLHSTYLKNPFLTEETVKQIESYKDKDENMWRIYGLGQPGYSISTIYTHQKYFDGDDLYQDGVALYKDYCYGLDVGYSHKMAMVKCYFNEDKVWVEQLVYKSGLTAADLIKLIGELGVDKHKDIWVDAASPVMIEDLKRVGYNAKGADKSVKEGIDLLKSKYLFLCNDSDDLIDEFKLYNWKTKDEEIIYEPVKVYDDLVDAARYCIFNHYKNSGVSDWRLLFK